MKSFIKVCWGSTEGRTHDSDHKDVLSTSNAMEVGIKPNPQQFMRVVTKRVGNAVEEDKNNVGENPITLPKILRRKDFK